VRGENAVWWAHGERTPGCPIASGPTDDDAVERPSVTEIHDLNAPVLAGERIGHVLQLLLAIAIVFDRSCDRNPAGIRIRNDAICHFALSGKPTKRIAVKNTNTNLNSGTPFLRPDWTEADESEG
jgi:hypothetical protein